MNVSEKAKQQVENCRFCWMCRHVCPIGNASGQERNTARARALALSAVERGSENICEVVDNIYECALCGACTNNCATGWDPIIFTIETRTEICNKGLIPSYIEKLLEKNEKYGNIYGETLVANYPEEKKGNKTLLFIGEDARYKVSGAARDAVALLEKAGVTFDILSDEPNSGRSLWFITGKTGETETAMKKCAEILNGYDKVIVYDPFDLKLFLREYKEYGVDIRAKIESFNDCVLNLLESGKIDLKKTDNNYTIQDNYNYSRELDKADVIRKILIKTGKIIDMITCGKETFLAGNLIMNEYMPEIMKEVAKARWRNFCGVDGEIMVTESPAEYYALLAVKPENANLKSLEQIVYENI